MWKKILLLLLLVIVGVPACGLAYLYLRKPAQIPASTIKVAMTPERIARGRLIFQSLAHCDDCHSQRDFTRFGGPVVESGRGRGNILSAFMKGVPGTLVAPNITPDRETGIGNWTDGEKIRAIREGVDRDGRALIPAMPYPHFRNMSDEDVQSVVAYLDTLSPVRNPLPQTHLTFPIALLIKGVPQPVGSVPPPGRSDKLKYGQYLVTLADCVGCHTPRQKFGQPIPGMELAGGQVSATSLGTVVSANITPDLETGIGKWSEEYFLKKFYDYKEYAAGGAPKTEAFTVMPWLAFSQLPPEDLGAIYAFLRTKKPVHHPVETHPDAPKMSSAAR
jgi:mono/diheme cytochrome c family protein